MSHMQIEGLSKRVAQAICDDLDILHGNPKKPETFDAVSKHLEPDCDAWLAMYANELLTQSPGDAQAATIALWAAAHDGQPNPHGLTLRWARPEEKHDDAGNYAVPIRADLGHVERIVDRRIGDQMIRRSDIVERSVSWERPAAQIR